jgi:hypothetical protein
MKIPVEVTITAQAAQYQSLPRTVMWLSTVTVLVKPFTAKAPLPILSTSLEEACRVRVIAIYQEKLGSVLEGQLKVGRK